MSAKTAIEWTDRSWNPVRGCSVVSAGCKNCYAMKVAARFSGPGLAYEGLALRSPARWTGKVQLVDKDLLAPTRWRKPQRIFVNSMSDLFHEGLSDEAIDRVFAVMALAPRHTFQVLTKRPERMRAYLTETHAAAWHTARQRVIGRAWEMLGRERRLHGYVHADALGRNVVARPWPLPNVWLGVSVEDQRAADERIPLLLRTPAAVRFLSVEPLLGPVDLMLDVGRLMSTADDLNRARIDWVIVGGESGPGARPCNVAWIRRVVEQCREAGVPCFVKQLGARPVDQRHVDIVCDGSVHYVRPSADSMCHEASRTPGYTVRPHEMARLLRDPKGGDPAEWPADLRVRQFPEPR